MPVLALSAEAPDALRRQVVELWQACGLTRPWNPPTADLEAALERDSSTVLVFLDDDDAAAAITADTAGTDDDASPSATATVIGTVMVGDDGHRGWLYYLAVDPTRRGEGLLKRLVTSAEEWLGRRGVRKVQLMVRSGNPVSTLYPHLGYQEQDVTVFGRWLDEPAGR